MSDLANDLDFTMQVQGRVDVDGFPRLSGFPPILRPVRMSTLIDEFVKDFLVSFRAKASLVEKSLKDFPCRDQNLVPHIGSTWLAAVTRFREEDKKVMLVTTVSDQFVLAALDKPWRHHTGLQRLLHAAKTQNTKNNKSGYSRSSD